MPTPSDYDFDVISGPSTPPPAPAAAFSVPVQPRPPGAAPSPARPVAEVADDGGKS